MKKLVVLFIIMVFLSLLQAQEAKQTMLQVKDFAFCTGVENRTPVGVDSLFPSDVGRVYTFTKIVGASEPTSIFHVYYYNDKEMARIELKIGGSPWRTWSYKTILPEWKGTWKLEVLDADGNVLTSKTFKIQ